LFPWKLTYFLKENKKKKTQQRTYENIKMAIAGYSKGLWRCVLYPAVANRRCLGRCVRTMQAYGKAAPEILSALAVLDSKIS